MTTTSDTSAIDLVMSYWLEPTPATAADAEQRRALWFGGTVATDDEIRSRFGTLVEQARDGRLDHWKGTARGTLALLILIDQFSRNLYRGTPAAFSADPMALAITTDGLAAGLFDGLGLCERMFATLPLRHAEDVDAQKLAVELAVRDALAAPAFLDTFAIYSVDWARKHLDVIVRFGRFPHRNAVLGRTSTPAELEYLAYLKRAGQWL